MKNELTVEEMARELAEYWECPSVPFFSCEGEDPEHDCYECWMFAKPSQIRAAYEKMKGERG